MCISWYTNQMTLRNARCNDKDSLCRRLTYVSVVYWDVFLFSARLVLWHTNYGCWWTVKGSLLALTSNTQNSCTGKSVKRPWRLNGHIFFPFMLPTACLDKCATSLVSEWGTDECVLVLGTFNHSQGWCQ